MPITNATVIPIIIVARLVQQYRRRIVFADRVNRTWQSQLRNGGNQVRLNMPVSGNVRDYDPSAATPVTYRDADVQNLGTLELQQAKYFATKINDIQAVQSSSPLLDSSVEQDGIALAEQVDDDVRSVTVAGATTTDALTLDHDANTIKAFAFPKLHRIMDVALMPREGRWVIVGPYTAEALMAATLEAGVINASVLENLQNGLIGTFAGLRVYVDAAKNSTFPASAAAEDANKATEEWVFGNDSAVAFIDQVREVERLRLQSDFADAVRGLYTYGTKVIYPARIHKATATIENIP